MRTFHKSAISFSGPSKGAGFTPLCKDKHKWQCVLFTQHINKDIVCLFVFQNKVSLCSLGSSETHSVDQAVQKLKDLPGSAKQRFTCLWLLSVEINELSHHHRAAFCLSV